MGCPVAGKWIAVAFVCLFSALFFPSAAPTLAQETKAESDSAGISEKEAYEAAKELGTIEAWEAFLETFPSGFRADLARAYVKRIGSEDKPEDAPATAETPATPETQTAESPPPPPPAPADISLAITSAGSCNSGRNCSLTVTATNAGGEPFTGDLTIATSLSPGGANLQGSGTPPFSCEGAGGGAICSTGLANIAPGESTTLPLTFTLPRNAGGRVTTCARIAWGGVPANLGAREVQQKLNELGFNAGPADGQPGRKTVAAIRSFQQSAGTQQTGEIDLPLLLALFAPGGPGDANPGNDQACAGAAVTQAPPLPTAYVPPPAPVPAWTPPRGYKKVRNPRSTGKCSSRSVWLEGQCILKTHVKSFCGPGFTRRGSRCVSNASVPGPAGPAVVGCSGNAVRIGNVCVNVSSAPVFGGRPGRGGGGQNFTGGGNRPNRPQGGGGPTNTGPLTVIPSVNTTVGVQNPAPCPPNTVRASNGSCSPLRCPSGQTLILIHGGHSSSCVASVTGKQCPYPGQVFVKGRGGDACICPGGTGLVGNKCVRLQQGTVKILPGAGTTPLTVIPGVKTTVGGNSCPQGQIRYSKGGKCVPGRCPSNATRSGNGTCVYGLTPRNKTLQNRNVILQQQQPQSRQVNCSGGRVANANGQCQCPPIRPRWSKGQCKKAKAFNQVIQQLQQPNNRPQNRPRNQQQQQQPVIKIPGLGGITISDARLKRDIVHFATRDDGLKLYAYRYLWDDTQHVGVMAQDLLADPERADAVLVRPDGYYMVDYGKLGLQ